MGFNSFVDSALSDIITQVDSERFQLFCRFCNITKTKPRHLKKQLSFNSFVDSASDADKSGFAYPYLCFNSFVDSAITNEHGVRGIH